MTEWVQAAPGDAGRKQAHIHSGAIPSPIDGPAQVLKVF